jgi:hypothetical protein
MMRAQITLMIVDVYSHLSMACIENSRILSVQVIQHCPDCQLRTVNVEVARDVFHVVRM